MVLNIEGEMEGTHIESDGFNLHFQAPKQLHRRKVIIDTDPGIDDMMAIFMAFQSQDIEVIGLTTVFGNVETPISTINALHLCEVAGFPTVPVAEGSLVTLKVGSVFLHLSFHQASCKLFSRSMLQQCLTALAWETGNASTNCRLCPWCRWAW
jgi:hypothetical protein